MSDEVFRPSHYQPKYEFGPECIEAMRVVWGNEKTRVYCELAIFKYLYRYQDKNGAQDLEKIKAYCDILICILNEEPYNSDGAGSRPHEDEYGSLISGLFKTAKLLCEDQRDCVNCPVRMAERDHVCPFTRTQEPRVCSLGLD